MKPDFYLVREIEAGFLAVMPRPRAGDWLPDEISGLRSQGVSLIVSLLESHEEVELGLETESEVCADHQVSFMAFPIPDRGVPTELSTLIGLLREIRESLREGAGVAIHCRAGIGRTGLVAGALLVSCGTEPDDAFSEISAARGALVPDTEGQIDWLFDNARHIREGIDA